MAIFCLPINYLFDNSNFTRAHIAQLVERFHGNEKQYPKTSIRVKRAFFFIFLSQK